MDDGVSGVLAAIVGMSASALVLLVGITWALCDRLGRGQK